MKSSSAWCVGICVCGLVLIVSGQRPYIEERKEEMDKHNYFDG